jgi:protein SCO1
VKWVVCLVGMVATLSACSSPSPSPSAQPQSISDAVGSPETPRPSFRGMVPARPYALPSATFTDTSGAAFQVPGSLRSPVTLVFFGYTHCPDVCTTVLADLAQALRRLDPASRAQVSVLFFTSDPSRDTPRAIRAYLDRFDTSFVGLTGSLSDLELVATSVGVPLEGTKPLPGGGYEVGHGAQIVGFDARHRGRVVWLEGTPIGDLRADLKTLVEVGT